MPPPIVGTLVSPIEGLKHDNGRWFDSYGPGSERL